MAKKQAKALPHRRACEACGKEWHEDLVRECPKKRGHFICRYCCVKCKWVELGGVGTGCRAFIKEDGGTADRD